jgi:hypothetical protein
VIRNAQALRRHLTAASPTWRRSCGVNTLRVLLPCRRLPLRPPRGGQAGVRRAEVRHIHRARLRAADDLRLGFGGRPCDGDRPMTRLICRGGQHSREAAAPVSAARDGTVKVGEEGFQGMRSMRPSGGPRRARSGHQSREGLCGGPAPLGGGGTGKGLTRSSGVYRTDWQIERQSEAIVGRGRPLVVGTVAIGRGSRRCTGCRFSTG